MEELKVTLPEGVNDVKVEFDTNKETGNSRLIITTNKNRVQYVGRIETQHQLDMIVDTLLYTAKL